MDTRHSQMINGVSIFFLTVVLFLLFGCSFNATPQPQFIPPRSVNTPTEIASSTQLPLFPTSTTQSVPLDIQTNCSENLRYIGDITIPDGTNVKPGTAIDKQWQVENKGSCNWDYRYSLRLKSGESMGAENRQALYPAISGSQFILQIRFISPIEPGTYQSVWQAYNPNEQPFGDPLSLVVVVLP